MESRERIQIEHGQRNYVCVCVYMSACVCKCTHSCVCLFFCFSFVGDTGTGMIIYLKVHCI